LHNLRDHPVRKPRDHASVHPPPSKGPSRAPGSEPDSAPIAAAPRPRARLRDDRRATQPRSSDDLESPSNWAGVAITARTQATSYERRHIGLPYRSRIMLLRAVLPMIPGGARLRHDRKEMTT
jgi:hypothetical protein